MKTIAGWAWLGQWMAALIGMAGIGVELALHADLGYVLISVCCVVFAISTKISRIKELKH